MYAAENNVIATYARIIAGNEFGSVFRSNGSNREAMKSHIMRGAPRTISIKPIQVYLMIGSLLDRPRANATPIGKLGIIPVNRIRVSIKPPQSPAGTGLIAAPPNCTPLRRTIPTRNHNAQAIGRILRSAGNVLPRKNPTIPTIGTMGHKMRTDGQNNTATTDTMVVNITNEKNAPRIIDPLFEIPLMMPIKPSITAAMPMGRQRRSYG